MTLKFKSIRTKIHSMGLALHVVAAIGGISLGLWHSRWEQGGGEYPNPVKYFCNQNEKKNNPVSFERKQKIHAIKKQRDNDERALAKDYRAKRKLLEKTLIKDIQNAKDSRKGFRVIMYLERNIENALETLKIEYDKNINTLYERSWIEISKINNEE